MADKKYHIIILSEDTEEIKRLTLGRNRLRLFLTLAGGLFLGLSVILMLAFNDYRTLQKSVEPLKKGYETVRDQNLKMRRELDRTYSRLREVTYSFMNWKKNTENAIADIRSGFSHIARLKGKGEVPGVGGTGYRELSTMFDEGMPESFGEVYAMVKKSVNRLQWVISDEEKNIIRKNIRNRGLRPSWPLTRVKITSYYGKRWDPLNGNVYFHRGIDLGGRTGDPVYAAEGGHVNWCGMVKEYGNLIIINHGRGISTRYAHLSVLAVKAGSNVKKGDLIGFVGMTGRSTGPHLHFETRINGECVNPLKILR